MYDVETFIRSYRGAMVWANAYAEQDGEIVSLSDSEWAHLDPFAFTDRADRVTREDCEVFLVANLDTLESLAPDYGPDQAGLDFALTRNRHGAGFWDRGLGEAGDILTANAHPFGESHLYVTADGELDVLT